MNTTRKGILAYLGIAFGMAWIAWEIPMRAGLAVTDPLFQLFALPGAFAPAIAALVVRKFVTREGFADAGLAIHVRRWPYFLIAWLLPLAVVAVIAAEAAALSIARPDFSIAPALHGLAGGSNLAAHLPPHLGLLIVPQLCLTALVATPILWGEEFGWRGYLQPRLFPDRPLAAAAATGVIWAVWHYPLLLRGYDFPDHPRLGALMFPVPLMLLSVIFGWLRQRSGSIWAASLAHAASNAVGGSLSMLWYYGAASPTLVGYLGLLAWPPLAALALWIVLTGRLQPESHNAAAAATMAPP